MKTYHNEGNTGRITKIALNFVLDIFGLDLQNSDFQSNFDMSKIIRIFLKNFLLKNINLGHQLL